MALNYYQTHCLPFLFYYTVISQLLPLQLLWNLREANQESQIACNLCQATKVASNSAGIWLCLHGSRPPTGSG